MEKTNKLEETKIIVVIALGFIGDTLLVEPMCRNLKSAFANSKLVFIATKSFCDIPKGFESVDEVYAYDKKGEHKGLFGYFKFLKSFPYKKNIDYAIITHPHERSIILAKMINPKNIISLCPKKSPINCLVNKKRKYVEDEIRNTYKAKYNLGYINTLAQCSEYPVCYKRNDINDDEILAKFNLPQEYVVLSPTAKCVLRDWDYDNTKEFIKNCGKEVVLVGTQKAQEIAKKLSDENIKFINLSQKTNIIELGVVLKHAMWCVSVDTGTFHFAYAQNVKTIGIFFNKQMVTEWAPNNLDNVSILLGKKCKINDNVVCEQNVLADDVIQCIKLNEEK